MNLFLEIHSGLPREAPGNDASTARALALIPDLPSSPRILDIGCGPGMQTLELARRTGGHITALDLHQRFLDDLRRRAESAGLASQITTLHGSMFDIPLPPESFDLIWSEGAIYIIGFDAGLAAWRPLLKPGGYLAVTELSWLTRDIPEEPAAFWRENYPAMRHIDENLARIAEAGYEPIGNFTLPEEAWWDDYYLPLERRIEDLRRKYSDDEQSIALLDGERREIEMYRRYSNVYGYVFYLMKVGSAE